MGLSFRLGFFQRERMIKRRKRNRRRRHDLVAPKIPMDVLVDKILTRLPPKSLMRFKCVSKLWSSIISSQYFTNRFLMVASTPRLYMFSSIFGLYSKYDILTSAQDASTPSSFLVDDHLTIPQMGWHSQSLNGFMCYSLCGKAQIYNPATRQLVTLPALPSRRGGKNKIHYCFGHDLVNDQYKVICTIAKVAPHWQNAEIMSEHWVYVLKPEASWEKTMDFCPNFPISRGVSINGVIYYKAWIDDMDRVLVVVSFDIRSEDFKIIQAPSKDSNVNSKISLIEYGGKLAALDHTNLRYKGLLDLYVLEDDSEWSMKTLVLKPCQRCFVRYAKLKVKGTTQSGKVLLIPEVLSSPFNVICYDLQSNDMTKIELKGIPEDWFYKDTRFRLFDFLFMDQSESIVYLKT